MHPLPLSLRLFAVAFWLGVVAVEFLLERSRAESRDRVSPETATKADSFAGVNRYSRQIARISLLAIPAGLLALGCGPYLMRQR